MTEKKEGRELNVLSVDQSMINSIESDLRALSEEYLELGMDQLLENELIEAIPFVRTLKHFYGGTVSFREYLFTRKVLHFLEPLSETSEEDRAQFAEKLEKEDGTRTRAGTRLLLLIDRLDDLDKPQIVGRLYRATILGKISFEELRRFCSIVDRSYLPDLEDLSTWPKGQAKDPVSGPSLEALGLAVVTVEDLGGWGGAKTGSSKTYTVSELGKKLLLHAFGNTATETATN